MADNMSPIHIPLTIIVAATTKNGIGKNNALPWPMLKKELAYFARVTKRVPILSSTGPVQSDAFKQSVLEGTRRNAVIMGRKTWESIPAKFRPLKDRTNIIISSQGRERLDAISDDVIVASDIVSGLRSLEGHVKDGKAMPVGRAFVIGGASIYQSALDLPQTKCILLTRIQKDYDCDTFFPEDLANDSATQSGWQKTSLQDLRDFVDEDVQDGPLSDQSGDEVVEFEFQLFERP